MKKKENLELCSDKKDVKKRKKKDPFLHTVRKVVGRNLKGLKKFQRLMFDIEEG